MANKETAEQRAAREGGENEAQAGLEYHRQMNKGSKRPQKRAIGRKLKK
jgi:hypothetical protein